VFTEQVGLLEEAKTPQALIDALRFLLGNCTAELTHRGSLALLGNRKEGATDAVLQLANYGNGLTDNLTLPDSTTGEMPNGWALDVLGGAVRFQGQVVREQGWAKAQEDWNNVAGQAPWVSYVTCKLCTDHLGTEDPRGRTIVVYLPRSTTRDPNVRTGDVIRYELAAGGRAVCTSEVYDGKIGEIRELGLGEDPTDYPMRGWDLADGGGGTDNLSGDNSILYGYTGAGAYTGTAGSASIANSFTATISGNGGTVAVTFGGSGTVTTSTDGAHTHNITQTALAAGLVVTTPAFSHSGNGGTIALSLSGSGTVTTSTDGSHSHDVTEAELAAQLVVTTPTLSHSGVGGTINTQGHTHTIEVFSANVGDSSATSPTAVVTAVGGTGSGDGTTDSAQDQVSAALIAGALSNHAGASSTITTTGGDPVETDSAGSHSHTASIGTIAGGLSGTVASNSIAATFSNHSASACTITTTGGNPIATESGGNHSHTASIGTIAAGLTGTVSSNSIAATLSIGTPSANRPAGKLVVRIQRVS